MHVEDAPRAVVDEVSSGRRFAFGENWSRFLAVLNEARIREAERSLQAALGTVRLDGRSFLDVGCGSGLFSLAAMRLGARRVHSFDLDPSSVACAFELRRRFFPEDEARWTVAPGDALDPGGLEALGRWDVVYSWGVLHHTGAMWEALGNVAASVAPGGRLYIAIYNDQGRRSAAWRAVKRLYNRLPGVLQSAYVIAVMGPREVAALGLAVARGRPGDHLRAWTGGRRRGMSRWHDLVDWVGGYPFEVARPDEVFTFYAGRGFALEHLVTVGPRLGCNEYVFRRDG